MAFRHSIECNMRTFTSSGYPPVERPQEVGYLVQLGYLFCWSLSSIALMGGYISFSYNSQEKNQCRQHHWRESWGSICVLVCLYVYVKRMVKEEEVRDLECGCLHGRIRGKRERIVCSYLIKSTKFLNIYSRKENIS